jgi:hypothetical protein
MGTKHSHATPESLDRARRDVEATAAEPEDDHLTDEQFVDYSIGQYDPAYAAQVETHLASCAECTTKLDHLRDVARAWGGPAGEQRLADLSRQIIAAVAAAGSQPSFAPPDSDASESWLDSIRLWAASIDFAPAYVPAGAAMAQQGETRGVSWSIEESPNRDLVFTVSSFDVALAGVRLQFSFGRFQRAVTLERLIPGQVGATVVIPAAERESLSPKDHARVTVLPGRDTR